MFLSFPMLTKKVLPPPSNLTRKPTYIKKVLPSAKSLHASRPT
jgi:hypothetical protein